MGSKHPHSVFIIYDMGESLVARGTIHGNFTWSNWTVYGRGPLVVYDNSLRIAHPAICNSNKFEQQLVSDSS